MKILFITGDEYSFVSVENEIGLEEAVKLTEEAGGSLILDEDFYAELKIMEFGEVDPKYVRFVADNFLDYDSLKDTNYYTIREEN